VTRFVVYGAGAVGGTIGARLHEHGHDVALIARGAHYEALRSRGLTFVDPHGRRTLQLPVVSHPSELDLGRDDVVILATKTQDTAGALRALGGADAAIVCAQNGVENERLALRCFEDVYGMCVMLPAQHLEPGVVEASSAPITGLLDIGRAPCGCDDRAREIAAALDASTFESIPRADIMRWKYAKLLMNLANAAEAVCGATEGTADIARRARSEGAAVLRAAGIDAASREEDRERRSDKLQVGTARGGGSSWQSLRRQTGSIEADYLNGEIVLLGRLHGVDTPVNALLQRLANEGARARRPPGFVTPEAVRRLLDSHAS
jgi:2-dehydropantoate 2-reductase